MCPSYKQAVGIPRFDADSWRVTKVIVYGVENAVMLTEMYRAPRLEKNIVSYGLLEKKVLFASTTVRYARFLGVVKVLSRLSL